MLLHVGFSPNSSKQQLPQAKHWVNVAGDSMAMKCQSGLLDILGNRPIKDSQTLVFGC